MVGRRHLGVLVGALAASAVLAAGPREASAAYVMPSHVTYLDATAWAAAGAGNGLQSGAMVIQAGQAADGFGGYDNVNQTVTVVGLGGTTTTTRRLAYSDGLLQSRDVMVDAPLTYGSGWLDMAFGCYAAYNSCVGMLSAHVVFDQPVWGFAGTLMVRAANYRIDQPLGGNLDVMFGGLSPPANPTRYDGFFGVLFSAPVTDVTFVYSSGSTDGAMRVDLSSAMTMRGASVAVPEPSTMLLLAPFVLGIVAMRRRAR